MYVLLSPDANVRFAQRGCPRIQQRATGYFFLDFELMAGYSRKHNVTPDLLLTNDYGYPTC